MFFTDFRNYVKKEKNRKLFLERDNKITHIPRPHIHNVSLSFGEGRGEEKKLLQHKPKQYPTATPEQTQ